MRAAGLTWSAISRELGVSRAALRDWHQRGAAIRVSDCPRCDDRDLDAPAYAALLGFYLGGGCLSRAPRYRSLRTVSRREAVARLDELIGPKQ